MRMMRMPVRARGLPARRPAPRAQSAASPFDVLAMQQELQKMHREFATGLTKIEGAMKKLDSVKKGSPGLPGRHGRDAVEQVTHEQIVAAVREVVVQPKDGVAPSSDEVVRGLLQSKKFLRILKKNIRPGEKGKDGTSPEASALVAMVVESLREKGIPMENIQGLENRFAEIRNQAARNAFGPTPYKPSAGNARGGGDTVVAGPGIVITDTVNGNKMITAVGGGLTPLPATGTIDGVNTVFTFTTAPVLIVADGVMFPAVGGNGTVFWTIVGTTVTMVNPPTYDIFGFE